MKLAETVFEMWNHIHKYTADKYIVFVNAREHCQQSERKKSRTIEY